MPVLNNYIVVLAQNFVDLLEFSSGRGMYFLKTEKDEIKLLVLISLTTVKFSFMYAIR